MVCAADGLIEMGRRTADILGRDAAAPTFASSGARRTSKPLPLLDALDPSPIVSLSPNPLPPILERLKGLSTQEEAIHWLIRSHSGPAPTSPIPPAGGLSAGKNTYTYDAHTYHTKVPPQGIAKLLRHYLPHGGLVYDPFAGSGMTGVACGVLGQDCVLTELSPAACFIADRFTSAIDARLFEAGVKAVLAELQGLRDRLYRTTCRECGRSTEIQYTVWSYNVVCPQCGAESLLWDHCRRYGKRVREHKIISEFACPVCGRTLHKSRLRRTFAEPVQLGYVCCGSRQQEVVHLPSGEDLELLYALEVCPPLAAGFYPTTPLPEGVNLSQPKRHGLDRIDRLYTPRNLAAVSNLWKTIHRVEDADLAGFLAFIFTSLYQRVTRLSEFRFWGGSGNTARFNVPFIFNEANVFLTFERKARSIQDHLETTASQYKGRTVVVRGSATDANCLPDESVDLVFTDPPFGSNINYSDMNFLWESWLGDFTDTTHEAIVNRFQNKGIEEYRSLMTQSLKECYRVLRSGRWLLLMFMNSSRMVWEALRQAVLSAGFEIVQADIFDKRHGTFKQFVADNAAGYDLVLHCRKPSDAEKRLAGDSSESGKDSAIAFLEQLKLRDYKKGFLHVERMPEIDFRKLYSEWTAETIQRGREHLDFVEFRRIVEEWINAQ